MASVLVLSCVIAFARRYLFAPTNEQQLPASLEVKDELLKMANRFKIDTSMQLSGTIKLYSGEDPDILKEKQLFSFKRMGGRFFSAIGNQQTVSDGNVIVQMDSVNKVLLINMLSNEMKNALVQPFLPVDKLFSDSAIFKLTGIVSDENNTRKLVVKNDYTPEIKQFTISYNPHDYVIKQAEIQWWKNPGTAAVADTVGMDKIWITRIEYNFSPFSLAGFNNLMNSIMVVNKGVIQVSEKYRKYKVYNNSSFSLQAENLSL